MRGHSKVRKRAYVPSARGLIAGVSAIAEMDGDTTNIKKREEFRATT
jgi:hypothetical protein